MKCPKCGNDDVHTVYSDIKSMFDDRPDIKRWFWLCFNCWEYWKEENK